MRMGQYMLVAVVMALWPAALAWGDEKGLDRDYVPNVRQAARQLTNEVENLQEDIVSEMGGQKERALYRQVDVVLAEIAHFRDALKDDTSRTQLYRDFDAMDKKLHELLRAVDALGENQRAVRRSAARV